jgi:anaerobic selenocysteine-containing dehydrogenase
MAIQQMHTYCAMCESRCGVVATVEDGLLQQVRADSEHPNRCICVKGSAAPEIVYLSDRLRSPMVRTRLKGERDPGWARLSWDEALALAASHLLTSRPGTGPRRWCFPVRHLREVLRRTSRAGCTTSPMPSEAPTS